MKTVRTFIVSILALIIIIIAAPISTSAQKLTIQERRDVVAELEKTLPMEVSEGMTWTKIQYNQTENRLTIVFLLSPDALGVSLADIKKEVNTWTTADLREITGNDFTDIMNIFECAIDIKLAFPDNTSKTFHYNK